MVAYNAKHYEPHCSLFLLCDGNTTKYAFFLCMGLLFSGLLYRTLFPLYPVVFEMKGFGHNYPYPLYSLPLFFVGLTKTDLCIQYKYLLSFWCNCINFINKYDSW